MSVVEIHADGAGRGTTNVRVFTDSGLEWRWVKGHSGVEGNERPDLLANQAIDASVR